MSFPMRRYHTCAGRIVGVTQTRSGTLLTVILGRGQELPLTQAGMEWLGEPVELLVYREGDGLERVAPPSI